MQLPTVDELHELIANAMGTGQVPTTRAAAEAVHALILERRRAWKREDMRKVRARRRERQQAQEARTAAQKQTIPPPSSFGRPGGSGIAPTHEELH